MQIIIFKESSEDVAAIEIPEDSDLVMLSQFVQSETGIPMNLQLILFNDSPLNINKPLSEFGIRDGAAITVKQRSPNSQIMNQRINQAPASSSQPFQQNNTTQRNSSSDISPEALLNMVISNPDLLNDMKYRDPELHDSLASRDLSKIRTVMMKRYLARHKQSYEYKRELAALEADPMNLELQKKLEQRIQQENIEENMRTAMDVLPEAFASVSMLYVNITVNDHPITAFVDSGAQSTIMSLNCAKRCGIDRLIDTRFSGEAHGVGKSKIVGRIHIAQMKFGNSFFPISITVLESDNIDFLFGLDNLKRYRCIIDLSKNVLRIDGFNGPEELPFLGESDIPHESIFQPNEKKTSE